LDIRAWLRPLVFSLLVRVGKLLITDRVVGALAFVPQIALLRAVLAVKAAGILVRAHFSHKVLRSPSAWFFNETGAATVPDFGLQTFPTSIPMPI
jgi:hypothetical protein